MLTHCGFFQSIALYAIITRVSIINRKVDVANVNGAGAGGGGGGGGGGGVWECSETTAGLLR